MLVYAKSKEWILRRSSIEKSKIELGQSMENIPMNHHNSKNISSVWQPPVPGPKIKV